MQYYLFCILASLIQQYRINITSLQGWNPQSLADICIIPTDKEGISFDVMADNDAIIRMVSAAGHSDYYYEIVIGGYKNRAPMIRKNPPNTHEDGSYLLIGMYLLIIEIC